MHRVRITVRHNSEDPSDDLRFAARLRRDLYAHSPVEIDPDSTRHGTHRDADKNAYFEFATDRFPEVERVVNEFGYSPRAQVEVLQNGAGSECIDCGNISPQPVTVCPNCSFRDIEACPYCNQEVPRLAYKTVSGNLFKCPACHRRVIFNFQDPLFDAVGHYVQPLITVSPAEAPVASHV